AIFADTMSVDAYFYANLTDVAKGSGRFLFLFDLPGQPARSKGGISLYGMLDFGLTDDAGNRLTSEMIESRYYVTRTNTQTFTAGANTTSMSLNYTVLKGTTTTVTVGGTALGADSFTVAGNTLTLKTAPTQGQAVLVTYSYRAQYVDPVTGEPGVNPASTVPAPTGFQVIIAGGVRADLFDNTLWAQLDGQATLTFTPTEFRLDVSAKLEVAVLGVIGTAAGKLVIKHGDGFEMYGALRIQTGDGLKKLEQYGLVLQGGLTLTINTTGTDKNIDLRLAATKQLTTTDTFDLTAGDFDTLYLTHTPKAAGALTVKQDGQLLVESTDGGKTGDYVLDRYNATVRLSKSITADTKVEVQYASHDYLDVHQVARAKSFTFVISAVGAFKVGGTEIFRLAASFAISIDSQGFTLIASGRLTIGPRSSPLLSLSVTALIYLGVKDGQFGFAASFTGNLTAGITGLKLEVEALVQINTFGKDIVFTIPQTNPAFETMRDEKGQVMEESRTENVPAFNADGSPKLDADGNRLTNPTTVRTVTIKGAAKNIDGTYQPAGWYILIRASGKLTIAGGFEVEANMFFLIADKKFTLSINGYMTLGPIGKVQVNAYVDISSAGMVGAFRLEVASGEALGKSIGLEISAKLRMELNTTSEVKTVKLDEKTTLTLNPGVLVRVEGTIIFAGVLEAEVWVQISYDSLKGAFRMEGRARANLVGIAKVDIQIGVEISSEGIALGASIEVEANLVEIIKVKAKGQLYINTMNRDVELAGRKIQAKSVYLSLEGEASIVEILKFNIKITAQVGGKFIRPKSSVPSHVPLSVQLGRGEWAFSFEASTTLFGIATVSLAGWVQSNGSYGIDIRGSIKFGGTFFGFQASMSARLYYIFELEELGFSASLKGKVYLMGIGIGLGAEVSYNSTDGRVMLYAEAELDFFFFSIFVSKTWKIGYISPRPRPYWLATSTDGRILVDESSVADDGGVLNLTIEDGKTRVYEEDDTDPIYSVNHVSTQADGSQTVMVIYNGRVKTYKGVRKIVMNSSDTLALDNPARGRVVNSTVYVGEGITSELVFDGGSGKDSFYLDGGSTTAVNTVKGGSGDDLIVVGGNQTGRRFRIEGGEGVNRLEGGAADDEIIGGSGVNFIIGNGGSDVIRTNGGVNYILGDEGSMSVPPGYFFAPRISTSGTTGGNDTIYASTGTNYILGGLGNDTIHAGGANTVVGDEGTLWFSKSGKLERVSSNPSRSDLFTGTGFQSTWTLSGTPLSAPVTVSVAGKALESSEFVVTGNTLVLGTAAASGTPVTVTYAIANSGTGGNDTMVASTAVVGVPMALIGGPGNDTLIGGSKSDSLIGDDGEIVLNAAQGVIAVESLAGSGNDVLIGNGGNDRMIGGSGNDTLTASTGKDVLIGDYGRVRFDDLGGVIGVEGPSGAGADTITGVAGNDLIIAGGGGDTVSASGDRTVVIGDAGEIR
ncbi:MAG: hypothetical protein RIT19_883, partial [Verrucomicrobiota bacterium]